MNQELSKPQKQLTILAFVILALFLYFYAPLTENERSRESRVRLYDNLAEMDLEKVKFTGPKKITEDSQIFYLWTYEGSEGRVEARVKKPLNRVESLNEAGVVFSSEPEKAFDQLIENNSRLRKF